MKRLCLSAIFVILCAGPGLAHETTGAIVGTVASEDAQALPGVKVVALDSDTGLERSVVSDRRGEFRLVALPPSVYEMTASVEGFQTHRRRVRVELGRTLTLHIEMVLGAFTDVIEVAAEAPSVDVTSTVTGINVSPAQIDGMVPVVHDTQRLALLAPATTAGDTAFNGSYYGTYDQKLVSIGGSSVAENSYQINGLNITNFRTGVGSTWVPFEFVDEVQVKTGGYEAEFGRSTGGVVNMVTKSGTNSLRGTASVFFEPESLQSYEPNTEYAWNQTEQREVVEANASLGFPIVKDKLFFFAFMQHRDTDYLLNSLNRSSRQQCSTPYYGGKVDWNITPSHRLDVTYFTDETTIDDYLHPIDDNGTPDETQLLSQGEINRGGQNYIGKYTGIIGQNFMLSAQYGVSEFDRTHKGPGDAYPYAWDVTSGSYHAIGNWTHWSRGLDYDEREAYRVDMDWYLDKHSLRGGADYEDNWSEAAREYSGGYRIGYFINGDRFPELDPDQMVADYQIYENVGGFPTHSYALYVQDRWSVTPNLTLNLGVRWEIYENKNLNDETFIKIDDQYAPRLGLIWDLSGQGRSKIHASYGVYHLPIASNTNIRMTGTEYYVADWLTVDGWNADGSPINLGTEPLAPQRVWVDGQVPDVRQVVSEDMTPMSQQEIIIGYEQMVGNEWSLGVRGIMKTFSAVIEDIGGDWGLYDIYGIDIGNWWGILANPGEDVTAWYDVDGDGELERYHFPNEDLGYPEPERNYYAVELTARKRFSNNFMLHFSYTWSHSYGNFEGVIDSTTGKAWPGTLMNFDYPGLTDYTWGDLPNDRRHNLKAFGVYAFDLGLQLGGNAYYYSGRPRNGMGLHPDPDDWASLYGVASYYVQGEPSPRGSWGTADTIWGLDAMVKYAFQIGSGIELNLRLDAFNITGNEGITEVDEEGDNDAGGINPNHLAPTSYQPPRTIRLGVGLTF